ncbi:hypothetical protein B0H63DRAFT_276546 [Podospora didyma]|uniref:Uncharacterized protein n=1 Tax=Podospora didyma TaxID=330526 RepID=A0AAE0KGE5_9PEZI|nr:hypothetical protein B0H63DRAFT_276546 [Podospora didyma]
MAKLPYSFLFYLLAQRWDSLLMLGQSCCLYLGTGSSGLSKRGRKHYRIFVHTIHICGRYTDTHTLCLVRGLSIYTPIPIYLRVYIFGLRGGGERKRGNSNDFFS